jgi:hypothetical protein
MDYFQLGCKIKIELHHQPVELYLSLRLVIHSEELTTKIRPVYVASVQADGSLSLDDSVENGEI